MQYQTVDLEQMGRGESYKLFITAIIPRPIGWLSTLSAEGIPNVAPFSWFNAVCGDPLMVMAAVANKAIWSTDPKLWESSFLWLDSLVLPAALMFAIVTYKWRDCRNGKKVLDILA